MKKALFCVLLMCGVMVYLSCPSQRDPGATGRDGEKRVLETAPAPNTNVKENVPANPVMTPATAEYKSIMAKDIVLKWKVDGANLKAIVSAPTTGWVAVGFGATDMMKNANIILGYVKDGQLAITNDYGVETNKHQPKTALGRKSCIIESTGTEANGHTEISFTIPLNTGDPKDAVLVPGQECQIILGYGPDNADNFKTFHKKMTAAKITL